MNKAPLPLLQDLELIEDLEEKTSISNDVEMETEEHMAERRRKMVSVCVRAAGADAGDAAPCHAARSLAHGFHGNSAATPHPQPSLFCKHPFCPVGECVCVCYDLCV